MHANNPLTRTDFLNPLNDLAYCCECAAQDYTGELKSELSTLCEVIRNKSKGYDVEEIQKSLPQLETALENYRSGNKAQAAMLLASVSRSWWKLVIPSQAAQDVSIKPDYGLKLQREGFGNNVAINFYNVPFQTVYFLAPGSYSVMLNQIRDGCEYAVSFDFNEDIFAYIVSKVPGKLRDEFGKCIIGNTFPFSAEMPVEIVAATLECRLGEEQQGEHEIFVPLVVVDIS